MPVDARALETEIRATIDEMIAEQGLGGAQISVRADDGVRIDVARGIADAESPLHEETRFPIFCLSKTFAAWAVLETCAAYGLDLDASVCEVLPEFGRSGKAHIRLRHLLANCAGIDEASIWPLATRLGACAADIYDAVCWAPPIAGWDPDRDAFYDYTAAYTTLGFWLERVHGRSYPQIVDTLTRRLAIAPGVLPSPFAGRSPWAQRAWKPQLQLGTTSAARGSLATGVGGSAANGAVASAKELCTLWSAVAGWDDGTAIAPEFAREMRSSQRGRRYCRQFKRICEYGYGVMTSLFDYHSWGLPTEFTRRSFGHAGLGVALAVVIPERRLIYSVILNGFKYPKIENFKMQRAIGSAICRHVPLRSEQVATPA